MEFLYKVCRGEETGKTVVRMDLFVVKRGSEKIVEGMLGGLKIGTVKEVNKRSDTGPFTKNLLVT